MKIELDGDSSLPTLVCIPGLMGGPEDFRSFLENWKNHFQILLIDPNSERREGGISSLTKEDLDEISYDSTSAEIFDFMNQKNIQKAFFVGISLGGKVVYDFAIRYPEAYAGGAITDVGLGPFEESSLHKFVNDIVKETNLNLAWSDLKKELQSLITDKNLRVLIQSQIYYPEKLQPPAVWKMAMKNFGAMLNNQQLDNQFELYEKVDLELLKNKAFTYILHSSSYSGMSDESIPQIKKMQSLKLVEVENSSHFLHVTHKEVMNQTVLDLLKI